MTRPASRIVIFVGLSILLVLVSPLVAAVSGDIRDLRKRLELALRHDDRGGLENLLDELGEEGSVEAARLILRAINVVESRPLFDKGVEILLGAEASTLDELFASSFANKKTPPLELASLLYVAGQVDDEERAVDYLQLGLESPSGVAQRTAIAGLERLRSKRSVEPLIRLLERDGIGNGTVAYDARRALVSLTGRDFASVEDWKNFWEVHQNTLDPKALDKDQGDTGIELLTGDDAPEFFGVSIISHRVVFVIDISGSMQKYDPAVEGDGGRDEHVSRERLLRTQRQLAEAINRLAREARFNIIAFNDVLEFFQKALVPASKSAKKSAVRFVTKLSADRGTHTDTALKAAFKDPEVDTIILLSDGAPVRSRQEGPEQLIPRILEDVRGWNHLRKVKIFTFGFEGVGEWPPGSKYRNLPESNPELLVQFLRDLAEEHGGKYTRIR